MLFIPCGLNWSPRICVVAIDLLREGKKSLVAVSEIIDLIIQRLFPESKLHFLTNMVMPCLQVCGIRLLELILGETYMEKTRALTGLYNPFGRSLVSS